MKRLSTLIFLLLSAGVAFAHDPIFVPLGESKTPYDEAVCCHSGGKVASAADGSITIGWSRDVAGSVSGRVRRFAADGTPLTAELDLANYSFAAGALDGSFAALSYEAAGQLHKIRLYDAQGNPGNTFKISPSSMLVLGSNGNGIYVALYIDQLDLKAVRFDSSASQIGSVIEVGQASFNFHGIDIAVAADGSFTAYYEKTPDKGDGQLHFRRFDAEGQALGTEHPIPPGSQVDTQTAVAADGFAAAAFELGPTGKGQFLDSSGALLDSFTLWDQVGDAVYSPDLVFLEGGDLAAALVVLESESFYRVHLFRLGRDGQHRGPALALPEAPPGLEQGAFKLDGRGDRVVIAWTTSAFDSSTPSHAQFQVYEATLFADSFESGDLSAWSLAP